LLFAVVVNVIDYVGDCQPEEEISNVTLKCTLLYHS